MNLTITDGFKLGCGLLLAIATAAAIIVVLMSAVSFFSALAGVRLPFPS